MPPVLLSGDHAAIARWRRKQALRATLEKRPDLLHRRPVDPGEEALLEEIRSEANRDPETTNSEET